MFFIHELQERVKINHLKTCEDYQILKSVSIETRLAGSGSLCYGRNIEYIYESLNFIFEILKRVIITGGNGFIGRHLVKRLAACKPITVVLISNTAGMSTNFLNDTRLPEDMPLTFHTADIRDRKAISNIFEMKERTLVFILLLK